MGDVGILGQLAERGVSPHEIYPMSPGRPDLSDLVAGTSFHSPLPDVPLLAAPVALGEHGELATHTHFPEGVVT